MQCLGVRLTVCEDNVGDSGKGCDQVGLDNGLDGHATGILDTQTDHTDNDSSDDTSEGYHGQPRHIVQSPRQGADQGDYQANHTKNDGAGTVIGQNVKGDGKGDQVTGHEKDDEEQLGDTEELPAKAAHEDLSGIRHTRDEWISELKLPHEVAGICRDDTDSDEDNQRPMPISFGLGRVGGLLTEPNRA